MDTNKQNLITMMDEDNLDEKDNTEENVAELRMMNEDDEDNLDEDLGLGDDLDEDEDEDDLDADIDEEDLEWDDDEDLGDEEKVDGEEW
jgi:hypothetical protein